MALGITPNTTSNGAAGPSSTARAGAMADARALSNDTVEKQAPSNGVSISATSRQLAQSAIRAELRDASMTRSQLADEAARLRDQFCGKSYNAYAAAREVPDTDDPALLERAKQATEFEQSHGKRGTNPFANLSDNQLTLVMYDDSGSYTKNERRAASREQHQRYEAWSKKVSNEAMAEYRATGQNDKFFQKCIDFYEGLPPIEQAQYPVNYVQRTQYWINNNKPFEGRDVHF